MAGLRQSIGGLRDDVAETESPTGRRKERVAGLGWEGASACFLLRGLEQRPGAYCGEGAKRGLPVCGHKWNREAETRPSQRGHAVRGIPEHEDERAQAEEALDAVEECLR